MIRSFHLIFSPITHITFNVSYLLTDADKQPADSLTKLAAVDIDSLLVKTPGISKSVLFNVQQALLKEWGPDSLGVILEDTMQELLTGVTFNFSSPILIFFYVCSCTIIFIISILFLSFYFKGLN